TAGHDGPITSGSSNVLTGGFPAARMGDTFVCKEHGPGVISEGSKTVTINGMPAARKGDKVVCGKKALPPTQGPKPPEYHYVTIAKNTNEDGTVKVKNPNEFQMIILLASSQLSDSDGDGNFDTANVKAVVEEFQLNHPMGSSGTNFNLGGVVGKAEMSGTTIANDEQFSSKANLKLEGVSGNIGVSSGKEGSGDYTSGKAEGTLGSVDAKGDVTITYDSNESLYGFGGELGAEAAAAKGEVSAAVESKYFRLKGSLGGSAGSVGLAGSAGGWLDTDNIMLKLKIGGEVALALGLKGDVEVQFGPFYDVPVPLSERLGVTSSKSGIVLSGMSNVIIGG
ncbi:hypothetical protein FQO46_21130, partial [Salmonella enterica]|nr:hypothetical protein [Salmonella enterica]EGK0818929.1 hypothetical protein [Salmonella enterica]